MNITDAWKQALADKLGMSGRNQHFEPDNRAIRRRNERALRGRSKAPRNIASRKPVKR